MNKQEMQKYFEARGFSKGKAYDMASEIKNAQNNEDYSISYQNGTPTVDGAAYWKEKSQEKTLLNKFLEKSGKVLFSGSRKKKIAASILPLAVFATLTFKSAEEEKTKPTHTIEQQLNSGAKIKKPLSDIERIEAAADKGIYLDSELLSISKTLKNKKKPILEKKETGISYAQFIEMTDAELNAHIKTATFL